MEAKELMYGDWYSALNGSNERDNYQFEFDLDYWDNSKPEPIPLTPKMLEANGFESMKVCNSYDFYKIPNNEAIYDRGFGVEYYADEKLFCITDHCLMPFKYVHEFQQALRLCGLNEIADNFKVD